MEVVKMRKRKLTEKQSSDRSDISVNTGTDTRVIRSIAVFAGLILLLGIMFQINLAVGTVAVRLSDLMHAQQMNETAYRILLQIRLPRILAAILLGGALSVSGFLLQTFFGNPIAGPFVLGISSGAKLVVSLAMIGLLAGGRTISSYGMIFAAFGGAMLSMGFILLVSRRVQHMSILIICGVMIGYICSAITDFVVTFADDSNIVNLHNWSMGTFSGTSGAQVKVMAVVVLLAVGASFLLSKPMAAYQLGEGYAKSMGVNVRLFRLALILLSSILSAAVTAFAGPVSFVGIAVPHMIRQLLRSSKPILVIPACFLGGACFVLFCDLIARTLFAPTELGISSVTAIFGAPVVIYMMIRRAGYER